ncbi:MAG: hypothetical protein QME92_12925 [Bacillota bacterium]|nr:hypothetical protein [Bacillota bacterium]
MRVIRRARRWWHRQLVINPGRIDSWLVGFFAIVATIVLVALVVRFMG